MCGRYSLALRPSQAREYLENTNMLVYDVPEDEGDDASHQSYNFAPGYRGIVYRADVPDWGAGPLSDADEEGDYGKSGENYTAKVGKTPHNEVRYKLQSMKWGLIPFWTKRSPNYGSTMKTINCRDDSLIEDRGMWTTMKQKKRCIVIAQGFYEWLRKPNSKEKIPHYIKRKDGQLLCMAGLWDCVQYEALGEKLYTYTIITTSSNKQLNFLHDRMPVIFDNGSEDIRTWLDPGRHCWSSELQSLLRPYANDLEVYPVSKDVGKVGNNSPSFIVPVDSTNNKSNIANFFPKTTETISWPGGSATRKEDTQGLGEVVAQKGKQPDNAVAKRGPREDSNTLYHSGTEDNAPLPILKQSPTDGLKRKHINDIPHGNDSESKKALTSLYGEDNLQTGYSPLAGPTRKTRSATTNNTASPTKPTAMGNQKITNFFR